MVSGHMNAKEKLREYFVGDNMNISYLHLKLILFWFVRECMVSEAISGGQDKYEQDGQVLFLLHFCNIISTNS